jgi:hypothetical protein
MLGLNQIWFAELAGGNNFKMLNFNDKYVKISSDGKNLELTNSTSDAESFQLVNPKQNQTSIKTSNGKFIAWD